MLDAYRAHPMLTAIFLMNVITLIGFGLYLWDKDGKTARYVLQMQADMKELRIDAMRVAMECAKQQPAPVFTPAPTPPRRPK